MTKTAENYTFILNETYKRLNHKEAIDFLDRVYVTKDSTASEYAVNFMIFREEVRSSCFENFIEEAEKEAANNPENAFLCQVSARIEYIRKFFSIVYEPSKIYFRVDDTEIHNDLVELKKKKTMVYVRHLANGSIIFPYESDCNILSTCFGTLVIERKFPENNYTLNDYWDLDNHEHLFILEKIQ